jgi:hypothetical protein
MISCISISSSSLRTETARSTLPSVPIYQTTWCPSSQIIPSSNYTSAKWAIMPDSKETCENLQSTDNFHTPGRPTLQASLNVMSSTDPSPRKMLKHKAPSWTSPSTRTVCDAACGIEGNLVCTKDINPLIHAHDSVVRELKAVSPIPPRGICHR